MAQPTEIRYLAVPRDGGESERDFVTKQALFYNTIVRGTTAEMMYTLVPACPECLSDQFHHDVINCALDCTGCGYRMSSLDIHTGRIAYR